MNIASSRVRAFTLIELMVVVAIVAILAALALPSIQGRVIRAQVAQGRALTAFVQGAVQAAYTASAAMPVDNAAAAVPPADHIVNNVVASVAVQAGAVVVTFGNQANRALAGHRLALRPGGVRRLPAGAHHLGLRRSGAAGHPERARAGCDRPAAGLAAARLPRAGAASLNDKAARRRLVMAQESEAGADDGRRTLTPASSGP